MSKLIDLTGQRFGRLTVIERAGAKPTRWLCECACGRKIEINAYSLNSGRTTSCGCFARECRSERKKTHGKAYTRLYNVWRCMKQRCLNPNHISYRNYGGRGITVCDEWLHDFQAFYDWAMANGYDSDAPKGQCTIDRVNVNGNYCMENCRWATRKEQNNNTRANRKIAFAGRTMTMAEWREELQISKGTVDARRALGWTPEEALGLIPRKKR